MHSKILKISTKTLSYRYFINDVLKSLNFYNSLYFVEPFSKTTKIIKKTYFL